MANWVWSNITISGGKESLKAIVDFIAEDLHAISEEKLLLSSFDKKPYPQDIEDWYHFNIEYFGCKWDCPIGRCDFCVDSIQLYVETPWHLPEPWMLRLSKDWGVDVECDYDAEDFGPGLIKIHDGVIISEELFTNYILFDECFEFDKRGEVIEKLSKILKEKLPPDITDTELASDEFEERLMKALESSQDYDTDKYCCIWRVRNPSLIKL